MTAVAILEDLRAKGYTAVVNGDKLKLRGPCRPPKELERRIADCRDELLEVLREETRDPSTSDTVNERHPLDCSCMDCSARAPRYAKLIEKRSEVLELARQYFGAVEDSVIPPPLPGRDPMVKRRADKAEFFMGDWREARPRDFKVYKEKKA